MTQQQLLKKTTVFCVFLSLVYATQTVHAQNWKAWAGAGLNLHRYFNPPPSGFVTDAKLYSQEWWSVRADLSSKKNKYLVFSPEIYAVGKGSRVAYAELNEGGKQSGTLRAAMFGVAYPVGISLVNKKGTGIRLSGGLYGEMALFAKFRDRYNSESSVKFENFGQRFNLGHMLAAHLLLGGNLEFRFCLMEGWGNKLYLPPSDSNVDGKWGGNFKALVISVAYGY
jgi:hypothetical protein